MNIRNNKAQRGATLIAFTLSLVFVVIPIIGLGIDAAIQYWVKARLSSAVDSAALAAGRSLNVGSTVAAQTANAQAVGRQYFAANFPTGTMGTTVFGGAQVSNSVSINVTTTNNYITVSASAQVNAPLYFLKILHLSSGVIAATSQSTRRNANVILVLDRSGSMNNASNSCGALIAAVQAFTNKFIDGRDELGLVTFSTTAETDYSPTVNFATNSPSLNTTLNSLVCVGATSTPQAMTTAYNLIKSENNTSALNVILFFTDGNANLIVANYPVKTQSDYRYDSVNYNSTVNTPASSCSATVLSLLGGVTAYIGSSGYATTGYTGGVFNETQPGSISAGSPSPSVISAAGCGFSSNNGCWGSYNAPCVRADVAYIPGLDFYGNATFGYKAVNTFTSGPYSGQIRPDEPLNMLYAAMNATDNLAQRIRADSIYNITTYTIGLSGNESTPMDSDFMERVANDPRASNYNPNQPQGMFVLASDNASLSDAFNAIASQILRLSK